jgi:hypothetical protein
VAQGHARPIVGLHVSVNESFFRNLEAAMSGARAIGAAAMPAIITVLSLGGARVRRQMGVAEAMKLTRLERMTPRSTPSCRSDRIPQGSNLGGFL